MPEAFTDHDVERLAALARLALTPEERSLFTRQLGDFLAYAEQVQQVDTSGIAPMSHPIGGPAGLRPDDPAPSLDRALALSQAPDAAPAAGLFKIPRVIG